MNDEKLLAAAVNAASVIEAIYEWLDRVDGAGGATSVEGVAACHAFLKSLRKNQSRVRAFVAQPLGELIEERKKEQAK